MFDPLSTTHNPFAESDAQPAWPSTPHVPGSPVPNLRRAVSPAPITPEKEPVPGLYGKEPRIYGQPEPGLLSPKGSVTSNGKSFDKQEPYLKVRITGLDRNRRDILIKFDAQVSGNVEVRGVGVANTQCRCAPVDELAKLYRVDIPQRFPVVPRIPAIL